MIIKSDLCYISLYTSSEMLKFKSRYDLNYVIGIIYDGYIIKPPRCKMCGEYVIIDTYTGYAQCDHCANLSKVYYNESINLREDWSEYSGD